MVEAVEDPSKEGMHFEENSTLAQLIKLRIAIEKPGRDKLVEYAHDEGRKDGEKDVVKGQSPRFENDFSRERILEGKLSIRQHSKSAERFVTYPELRHIQRDVLVEGIEYSL